MKTSTTKWMIAVAALAVAAGSASAQTFKADIPVSFRVGDKVMVPGSYEVRVSTGVSRDIVYVRNTTTHDAAVLMPGVKEDTPKAWREDNSPKLALACLGGSCSMNRIWNGQDSFAYLFPAAKAPSGDIEARATVITLALIKLR